MISFSRLYSNRNPIQSTSNRSVRPKTFREDLPQRRQHAKDRILLLMFGSTFAIPLHCVAGKVFSACLVRPLRVLQAIPVTRRCSPPAGAKLHARAKPYPQVLQASWTSLLSLYAALLGGLSHSHRLAAQLKDAGSKQGRRCSFPEQASRSSSRILQCGTTSEAFASIAALC